MNKPVTPTINKLKVNQILCNFSKIKKKARAPFFYVSCFCCFVVVK